eukprot:RCo001473
MLSGAMSQDMVMTWRTVSLMFTDIVGFTSLCESISSELLVRLMADFFEAMCEEVVATGGVLDKLIGDCIMALWNAPLRLQDHQAAACRAALRMQAALVSLNERCSLESSPEMKIRTGINTANVLVGNYGCDYRLNYTALGDGVNLASRLESSNKIFGTAVMVSEATMEGAAAWFHFRRLGRILVPGKAQAVMVYELLFERTQPTPTSEAESVLYHWQWIRRDLVLRAATLYEKAIALYTEDNPEAALVGFREALSVLPSDSPSRLLVEACGRAASGSAPRDGVIRVTK